MTKVTILGAGNFGFALANHLDRKNDPSLDLWLYARNAELVEHIQQTHTHPRFYPTTELAHVQATTDLTVAIQGAQVIIFAIASTGLRSILTQLKPLLTDHVIIVSAMKALDQQTGRVLTETIREELAGLPITLAALAGGTTGTALTQEQYLGATLACADSRATETLQNIFTSPYLRIQTTTDLLGVEYAGSLKNLVSVCVGITKGLGFAYGTQTHALSLIASECAQFAVSRDAQADTFTFHSQCWGNDMVMSSTDPDTRNHQFGMLLGEGLRFSTALEKMTAAGKTAEAANTLTVFVKNNLDLSTYPLLQFLVNLTQEKALAGEIVKIIETHP